MSMARTPFPLSILKVHVNDMKICKEVRCCCIYDNQTLQISIFCTGSPGGFVQFVIRPVLAVLSVLLFVRLKFER